MKNNSAKAAKKQQKRIKVSKENMNIGGGVLLMEKVYSNEVIPDTTVGIHPFLKN